MALYARASNYQKGPLTQYSPRITFLFVNYIIYDKKIQNLMQKVEKLQVKKKLIKITQNPSRNVSCSTKVRSFTKK